MDPEDLDDVSRQLEEVRTANRVLRATKSLIDQIIYQANREVEEDQKQGTNNDPGP